jgi:hypothetical protein
LPLQLVVEVSLLAFLRLLLLLQLLKLLLELLRLFLRELPRPLLGFLRRKELGAQLRGFLALRRERRELVGMVALRPIRLADPEAGFALGSFLAAFRAAYSYCSI